jgi:hypothetical protein
MHLTNMILFKFACYLIFKKAFLKHKQFHKITYCSYSLSASPARCKATLRAMGPISSLTNTIARIIVDM